MKKFPSNGRVSIELLRARVAYDAETGILSWRPCDARYFLNQVGWAVWHGKFAGKEVSKRRDGYVVVSIRVNGVQVELQGHRVVWALMTGEWPEFEVDHKDRDRSNNRWTNLRPATDTQQIWNRGLLSTNKTGVVGVHRHTQNGQLIAQIKFPNGKRKHLGCFGDDIEAAAEAYRKAAQELHGNFCAA